MRISGVGGTFDGINRPAAMVAEEATELLVGHLSVERCGADSLCATYAHGKAWTDRYFLGVNTRWEEYDFYGV